MSEVGRFETAENLAGIIAKLSITFGSACSVAHQAPRFDKFTPEVHRGQRMAGRQSDEVMRSGDEEWARGNEQRPGALLNERRKGRVDLSFGAGSEHDEPLSNGASRRLCVVGLRLCRRSHFRVYQQGKEVGIGQQLPH